MPRFFLCIDRWEVAISVDWQDDGAGANGAQCRLKVAFVGRIDRVTPQRPDLVARAVAPDYALGAHTASLGLAIRANSGLPAPFTAGAFVGAAMTVTEPDGMMHR